MTEPICEDEGILQEWAPEIRLMQQIPLKIQKGIFSRNLNLTCVDVVSEYIALGTNCGLIYWYCRATDELQRLRFEEADNAVTCVKIVSSVDYMVAGGTNRGNITIFQIHRPLEPTLKTTAKEKKKQIERFTINGLHNGAVTNIEWSQNGMKLFSGDKNGLVVLTEIDFYMHFSKSMELLNEQFEIVQLSYSQQILLISTCFRSIICDGVNKWKVHQVGTKERKILGKFGATLSKTGQSQELLIYASRPGHRLWLANANGSVKQTLLFKSAVHSSHPRIQLINPSNKSEHCESQFGKLLPFGSNKIIAYNSEMMYVLHPSAVAVACSLNSARKIIDLAVNEDEIFVLEGDRSLIRIGYAPNKYQREEISLEKASRRSFIFDELASRLKDTAVESFKKITSELVIHHDSASSPNSPPALADEALNLPPIVNLPSGSISSIIPEENIEIHFSVDVEPGQPFRAIDQNSSKSPDGLFSQSVAKGKECDEIISRPLRRRTRKKANITTSLQGQESESDTTSNASDDRLVWGIANDLSLSEDSRISCSQSQSSFSILKDIPGMIASDFMKTEKCGILRDGESKIVDDKSQTSLDTCESVSEHLILTPDRFSEEQEKTFLRLANQEISILDSYNSEKTDNMSISLNLTPSSSFSSKMSDNAPTHSEISENISMISETKTDNSPSNDSSENDSLPLPKTMCFCNTLVGECEDGSNEEQKSATSCGSEQSQNVPPLANVELSSDESILKTKTGHSVDVENFDNEVKEYEFGGDEDQRFTDLYKEDRRSSEGCESSETNVQKQPSEHLSDRQRNGSSSTKENSSPTNSTCLNLASKTALNMDQSDHWLQYTAPGPVICLAVASGYVVCIDNKGHVSFSGLSELSLSWNSASYKASWISLSNSANVVWVLENNTHFTVMNPSQKGPYADEMLEQNSNVIHFAVDNENPEGWIVKTNGQIWRQRNLTAALSTNSEPVPCDWLLTSVTCWNGVAMAITCEGSVVCKTPSEGRFRSIRTPKTYITCAELGPQNLAWIVDEHNNIYFSDDFLREDPHWWQLLISDYIFQNSMSILQSIQKKIKQINIGEHFNISGAKYMIASNENSVWIFDKCSNVLKVNKTAVTGYIWNSVGTALFLPLVRWHLLCVTGIYDTEASLWLLSNSGYLFISKPNSERFQSVAIPNEDTRCISSSVNTLWVLTSEGRIFSRHGLSGQNLMGCSWKELNLEPDENPHFVWISCGIDVAWGCDANGQIYITTTNSSSKTDSFGSVWSEVEGQPKDGTQFAKVFAGPNFYNVWAIDSKENIYVREGILRTNYSGNGWVLAAGLKATIITISSMSVWALSPDGFVYRRCGVSEGNLIGDYWKRIPGTLKMITSSFADELWGIDNNNTIFKLSRKMKILAPLKESKDGLRDCEELNENDNDWEIPDSFCWN